MATNDNTLKTLGFIYQTYIGLIKCLDMNENEKVIMEQLGDVTLISTSQSSQQIEVKHHFEDTVLSDRDKEIWNTIWNWYRNFDEYTEIDELILFTTARLSQKSIFRKWEEMNVDTRYQIIKDIGSVKKINEKEFRPIYDKIFSTDHNAEKLKSVLERLQIHSEQKTIKSIITKYNKTTFRFLSTEKRMEEFVSSLIGLLLTIPVRENHWEISYSDFSDIFKSYAERFIDSSSAPLQLTFEDYEPTLVEIKRLKNKPFVSEIQRIDLHDEITEAINDYCRTSKTIISYFETNVVKSKDLKDYRKQLLKTLSTNKKISKINCNGNITIVLPESQRLYLQSMALEARPINGVSNNRDFFQRGVIHSIVDDGDLTWHVGDVK
ncbi:hypothetical protein AWM70_22275 [Paenibacillus yonginensis]|uniref:Uncharacterized protein n=1 Tax=Paenibacillus yonginensis TaxID=1462996 RepID=A0A1B1N6B4_9BACL|nr:hypothetical protein [Paenibacillus yonginensis]ANS76973.1 hypothetical protein AWM70_22275 [Paenibacillus yonginensis]